jgi:hypothetical protein
MMVYKIFSVKDDDYVGEGLRVRKADKFWKSVRYARLAISCQVKKKISKKDYKIVEFKATATGNTFSA